ncbi:Etoposide-induced protein 2.4 [Entamoeba marina]
MSGILENYSIYEDYSKEEKEKVDDNTQPITIPHYSYEQLTRGSVKTQPTTPFYDNEENKPITPESIDEKPLLPDKENDVKQVPETFYELFFEGIKSYHLIRAAIEKIYKNFHLFQPAYKQIFLINVVYFAGFSIIYDFLIYPSLAHLFGVDGSLYGWFANVIDSLHFIIYNSLLIYALVKSETYYQEVAVVVNKLISKKSNARFTTSVSSIYFTILTSMILGFSILLGIYSQTKVFQILVVSLLYSFYAFNLKLELRTKMNLKQRVYFIDNRLFYFLGFGLIFTLCCIFFGTVLSNMMYSLLFPIVSCSNSIYESPTKPWILSFSICGILLANFDEGE